MDMTSEQYQFNKKCAEFLGWTYIGWNDTNYENYTPGWWSNVPKITHKKLTKHLYKGRSTRDLRFHWDWNWIMMVVIKIEKLSNGYKQFHIVSNSAYLNGNDIGSFDNPDGKKDATILTINQYIDEYNKKNEN